MARKAKDNNIAGIKSRQEEALKNKAHPVLGHPSNDEKFWSECLLAKTIVTRQQLEQSPQLPAKYSKPEDLSRPEHHGFGIDSKESGLLFEKLPQLSALATFMTNRPRQAASTIASLSEEDVAAQNSAEYVENHKSLMLARLTDLRNTNADGLAFENRKRIITAFSPPTQPSDTGRPEVQAALLTYQIHNLWSHLSRSKKDLANVRHLRRLVHQRAKVLKYLRRIDFQRFELCLQQIAIVPEAIEGEIIVNPV